MCHLGGGNFGEPLSLTVPLPLKWRNEDAVACEECINASSICFTDLLAQRFSFNKNHESKAFLCIQEEKDEEEWKETNTDF